jgi:aspartate/methionine/tyrosine aminotransferase
MAVAIERAGELGYYDRLAAEYDARRVALNDALTGAGFDVLPIQGSYFLTADVSGRGFESDVDFCRWLVTEHGVAAVPPSAFYTEPETAPLLARFCFAKKLETIEAAAGRLANVSATAAR